MSVGIYLEGASEASITDNIFYDIDHPVIIKNSRNIRASGNRAIYGSGGSAVLTGKLPTPLIYGSAIVYYLQGLIYVK